MARALFVAGCVCGWLIGTPLALAQDKQAEDVEDRFAAFEKQMSGATLVGQFSVEQGPEPADDALRKERYEIRRVSKLKQGDFWLFEARIVYGDIDVTVPIPLEVKWAGKAPVITLDNVTLPGLGTFSARVLIDGDRYAGTWTHDEAGGHMFGRVEPSDEQQTAPEKEPQAAG